MKKLKQNLFAAVIIIMSLFINFTFNYKSACAQEQLPRVSNIVFEKSPLYEGETQTMSIYSNGSGKVQYRVWLYSVDNNKWQDITNGYTSPISSQSVYKVSVPEVKLGQYRISVWIKSAENSPKNEKGYDSYFVANMNCLEHDGQVYDRRKDSSKSKNIKDNIPAIHKIVCEYSYLYEGDNQILDILASGLENVQYRIWLCNKKTNMWFEVGEGYTKPSYAQKVYKAVMPELTEGEYTVSVWIKREGKEPLNKKGYDEYVTFNINCLKTEKANVNNELNGIRDSYKLGEAVELIGNDKIKQYRYTVYDVVNNKLIANFTEYKDTLSWKASKDGVYLLRIYRKSLEEEYKINKLVVVGEPYKKYIPSPKSTGKVAYLTFDDGPSRTVTPRVLKILDDYNVKATFFIIGEFAERNKDLIRQAYKKGHIIANHTYSHQYKKIYASPTALVNELNKTDKILKSIIAEYNTRVMRFPGGSIGKSKAFKDAITKAGYRSVDWNALTGDAEAYLVSANKLISNVKNSCKNKSIVIILMHDAPVKTTTADALPQIIEYLKSQGYEFRTLE